MRLMTNILLLEFVSLMEWIEKNDILPKAIIIAAVCGEKICDIGEGLGFLLMKAIELLLSC